MRLQPETETPQRNERGHLGSHGPFCIQHGVVYDAGEQFLMRMFSAA